MIGPVRAQLVVGAIVEFVGCGEVRDEDGFKPLKLIPVELKIVAATEQGNDHDSGHRHPCAGCTPYRQEVPGSGSPQ
ncbi:MAG: hypothetical protein R3C56_07835 [Pirellulaceae bacterium]